MALEILQAKDHFLAAAIMQKHGLYYGKGDYKSIIETLTKSHPKGNEFKELGKKLGLFKHGFISKDILTESKNENPDQAIKLH